MYRKFKFVKEFEFVQCTILWMFKGKLGILDVQKVRIRGKFWTHRIYEFIKFQWKIMHVRCTNGLDSWENSNSLNVIFHEYSKENCVD